MRRARRGAGQPQFSRPPGRSSLGRAEAGRPGARGRTSRVSPIFAAGGALTGRRPELVQDSDWPARTGRHPDYAIRSRGQRARAGVPGTALPTS